MRVKEAEFEHVLHLTRSNLCYIEDSFRSIIFHLDHGNNDEVSRLVTEKIEITDRKLKFSSLKEPLVLPAEDFYFTIDYYAINTEENRGYLIYEFFDHNSERLFFCIAKFIEEGHTWYLDSVEMTQEPG